MSKKTILPFPKVPTSKSSHLSVPPEASSLEMKRLRLSALLNAILANYLGDDSIRHQIGKDFHDQLITILRD